MAATMEEAIDLEEEAMGLGVVGMDSEEVATDLEVEEKEAV